MQRTWRDGHDLFKPRIQPADVVWHTRNYRLCGSFVAKKKKPEVADTPVDDSVGITSSVDI
jgi:hypothetical protein